MGDIVIIWRDAIINQLGISKKDIKEMNVVLIVPDEFSESMVSILGDILLNEFEFKGIIIQPVSKLFGLFIYSDFYFNKKVSNFLN